MTLLGEGSSHRQLERLVLLPHMPTKAHQQRWLLGVSQEQKGQELAGAVGLLAHHRFCKQHRKQKLVVT